ncbi:uncharacterized protein MONOS_1369 [Monocercomonoides exilis]|uniref:uncharacterized protein n=1 Tax=Monocercomonoides exilis TaxID=2049356 RepID=UPI0035598A51|nr:hypothetical protein MONOS_1369 [Monocercomonoides exilis]|eukprot:MONOS_1369.1-p1 / transcript=MONOS_1369.1 / gene=MONOS_1369 / organism=Monocercomonoides_exilis_PA203 / gene_product=unspecified product / transcript_product=unspecified product / location=Mono_scaffold00023:204495-205898(+) / protein_length=369 / sequence_SO=supercontig / SO=protein_coding / is_pseudo=false
MSSYLYRDIELLQQQVTKQSELVDRLSANEKYMDAARENQKLEALKRSLSDKKKEALEAEQKEDEARLKSTYNATVRSFSRDWDDEMRIFEDEAAYKISEMKSRHNAEIREIQAELDAEPFPPLNPSRELRNLRNSQRENANSKRFEEAQKIKETADQLEEREYARHEAAERQRRISIINKKRLENMDELSVLYKKIDKERQAKLSDRQQSSQALQKRFKYAIHDEKKDQEVEKRELNRQESFRRCREASHHPVTTRGLRESFAATVGKDAFATRAFGGTAQLMRSSLSSSGGLDGSFDSSFRGGSGRWGATASSSSPLSSRSFGSTLGSTSSVSETRPRCYDSTFKYRSPSAPRQTATASATRRRMW